MSERFRAGDVVEVFDGYGVVTYVSSPSGGIVYLNWIIPPSGDPTWYFKHARGDVFIAPCLLKKVGHCDSP